MVIVLLMAIPGWLSRTVGAPTLLYAKARRQYDLWSAGAKTGPEGGALDGAEAPTTALSAAPPSEGGPHAVAAAPVGKAGVAAATAGDAELAVQPSQASAQELEVVAEQRAQRSTPFLAYTCFASAL